MTRHIQKATPSPIGAICTDQEDNPIGVVIEPPMWDPVKGAAITKKGQHCKRCLAKPFQASCWQHKVPAGEEVVAFWSPGASTLLPQSPNASSDWDVPAYHHGFHGFPDPEKDAGLYSVGVHQRVPHPSGRGLKRSAPKVRVTGQSSDPEAVHPVAFFQCRRETP